MMGARLNWKLRGTGLRVPWHRLLLHDWVKFLPRTEFAPYARRWYASNLRATLLGRLVAERTPLVRWLPVRPCAPGEWEAAVQHHVHRMDHHLEYYAGPDLGLWRRGGVMPDEAVVEMLADKMGSQWGYDGRWPDARDWDRLADGFDNDDNDDGYLQQQQQPQAPQPQPQEPQRPPQRRAQWPSARSKALFFAVSCAAGYESCFDRAGTRFGWKQAEEALGRDLTGKLRALARGPSVVLTPPDRTVQWRRR